MVLGQELHRIRTERKITPTELARRSNVSRARIYAIEKGESERPYSDTLIKLAKGLALRRGGFPDPTDQARVFRALQIAAGMPIEPEQSSGESPQDRVNQILAAHPEIAVAFAQVDDFDDDDAEMVEQVLGYVAKRSAEKRQRGQ